MAINNRITEQERQPGTSVTGFDRFVDELDFGRGKLVEMNIIQKHRVVLTRR